MNYWQTLGIAKTSDLAAIKRAYAVKLKKAKPDEDPEGFKRLHAAYKQASQYARANPASQSQEPASVQDKISQMHEAAVVITGENRNTAEESDSTDNIFKPADEATYYQHAEVFTDEAEDDAYRQELEAIANTDLDEEFAFLQGQWADMTARVDEATANLATMNSLSSWDFLNNREALLDLRFKSEMSRYIFNRIIFLFREEDVKKEIKREVFNFLDSLFLWSERCDLLEDEFGHETVDIIMQAVQVVGEQGIKWFCPRIHKGEMISAAYFTRVFATFLDWLLLGFIAVAVAKPSLQFTSIGQSNGQGTMTFIMGVLMYFAIAPIMESTPLQGTPGKILFGIKVVSKRGKRLNIFHALWRASMFGIVVAFFKITVWTILFLRGPLLIQDRLSGTMVIKR